MNDQLPEDIEDALQRFIDDGPDSPTREEAVERLVRESLERMAYLDIPKG